ncbi:transmembrane protein, putative [Medicago truncatula]|uniref:Transmembrane protein, putative n=1 Tax=Medicago truncatula TaxID=3880 RepID=G7JB08_MEDTR|nr:transmembrane protein, putative [Medicago truncatula]
MIVETHLHTQFNPFFLSSYRSFLCIIRISTIIGLKFVHFVALDENQWMKGKGDEVGSILKKNRTPYVIPNIKTRLRFTLKTN